MSCVCGLGQSYNECCLPIHTGKIIAKSPEQLMRARYSAFVKNELNFIKQTMQNKSDFSKSKLKLWLKKIKWKKLEIINVTEHTVEFKASYLEDKQLKVMHEHSEFIKVNGYWLYAGEVK